MYWGWQVLFSLKLFWQSVKYKKNVESIWDIYRHISQISTSCIKYLWHGVSAKVHMGRVFNNCTTIIKPWYYCCKYIWIWKGYLPPMVTAETCLMASVAPLWYINKYCRTPNIAMVDLCPPPWEFARDNWVEFQRVVWQDKQSKWYWWMNINAHYK